MTDLFLDEASEEQTLDNFCLNIWVYIGDGNGRLSIFSSSASFQFSLSLRQYSISPCTKNFVLSVVICLIYSLCAFGRLQVHSL